MSGDPFKRREVSPGRYQCGCRWERLPVFGDVIRECVFHAQVGAARLAKFEREQKSGGAAR